MQTAIATVCLSGTLNEKLEAIAAARFKGVEIFENDLLSFCTLLLIAGNVTTTNLISNAVITLLENPGELARLRSDRTLLPTAIEEVLRYTSPVQSMFRIVTRDVTFQDQTLSAGDRALVWIGSASTLRGLTALAKSVIAGRRFLP